ncbi:hypothetical protein C8F01DRAFT_1261182 [Mycena amicta]|nr:hypothetical protein C8F01DRAFT_1261182 [Mycena amicta]
MSTAPPASPSPSPTTGNHAPSHHIRTSSSSISSSSSSSSSISLSKSRTSTILGLPVTIPQFPTRYLVLAIALVQAIGCLYLLQARFGSGFDSGFAPADAGLGLHGQKQGYAQHLCTESNSKQPPAGAKDTLDMPLLATNAPTKAFRDNLRSDVNYLTSWPAHGWSHQVIEYMHLIYLARLTERVPILPRFRPANSNANVRDIDFGEVFDLERLRSQLRTPILEWKDVKDVQSDKLEELGCWDIHHKKWDSEVEEVYLQTPINVNVDVSYTPMPEWVRSGMNMLNDDLSMLLWPLASLVSFTKRANTLRRLPDPLRSPLNDIALPPDDHLFCTNSLYFDLGTEALQGRADLSPAWQSVGRHMRWTKKIEELAVEVTRELLGVEEGELVPPYIAVHIRRGDFSSWCSMDSKEECYAPLSAYERRVREVRAQLLEDTGVSIDRVIVTSDETDEQWWADVAKLGWLRPDHTKTTEGDGAWYPIFVDAAIQGAAYGFVGTETSSVSILARRRVSGRGGVAEMVKWGRPHADDH